MRFHQGGQYYYQIRVRNIGFRFTAGDTDSLQNIYAANIYGSTFWDNDNTAYYLNPGGTTSAILAGNVGIGNTSPATRLHIAGSTQSTAASGIPSLGYANSSSVALFTNFDVNYGTLFGTLSDGKGWIQQQRVDTGTSVYDLLLQPNGGNVGIGTTTPTYTLQVNGSTHLGDSLDTTQYGKVQITRPQNPSDTVFHQSFIRGGATVTGLAYVTGSNRFGLWSNAANNSGTPTMIWSSATVGINATNTAATFQVNNSVSNTGAQTVRIATTVGGANTVVDAIHIDHGGSNFNQGVAIALGYKDVTYGSYYSRIVNYTDTGVTQATKLQLQTQAGGGTAWNTGILIDTLGRVGINTASPGTTLDVAGLTRIVQNSATLQLYGTNHSYIEFYPTASAGRQAYLGYPAIGSKQLTIANEATNGDIVVLTNGTGYVGIGTSSPAYILDVNGRMRVRHNAESAGIWYNASGNNAQFFCGMIDDSNWGVWDGIEWIAGFNTNNTLTVKGDIVAYGSPSDSRLKDIKEKVPNALDTILKLNGYKFDWKESDSILQIKEDIGVIAQEVEEVAPELVRTNEETGMKSVRYQGLTAILIEAIKEQQKQIDELKYLLQNKK